MLGVVAARAEVSKLEALSMIESGDNDAAIGSAGEVSRYQIMPRIWQEYSKSRAYRDVRVSARVAEQHLEDLEQTFQKRARRTATDFDLYVLWNAGPTYYAKVNFSPKRVHPIIRERAQRYANLRKLQKNPKTPAPVLVQAPVAPAKLGTPLPPPVQALPSLTPRMASSAPVPFIGTTSAPVAASNPAKPQEMLAVGGIRSK